MAYRHYRGWRSGAVLMGAALGMLSAQGCAPRISRFDVEPSTICAGTPVQIAWKTNGVTALSAQPPVPGVPNSAVPPKGMITIAPDHTTILRIEVTRSPQSTGAAQEIRIRDAASPPKSIGRSIADASMRCDASGILVDDEVTNWDNRLRVVRIVSSDQRQYHIEHAGLAADVGPNVPSTAFAGTPVGGEWSLKTPIGPGEACGTGTLPRVLMIEVSTTCDSGGTP